MYLVINKWVIAVKVSNFSGQYLHKHWTLDIGVLGYIGIVWPKEHSAEVWSVPPVTPCIMFGTFVRVTEHWTFCRQAHRIDFRWGNLPLCFLPDSLFLKLRLIGRANIARILTILTFFKTGPRLVRIIELQTCPSCPAYFVLFMPRLGYVRLLSSNAKQLVYVFASWTCGQVVLQ